MLARTIFRESAAGLACRVRQAETHQSGPSFSIHQDSAEDRSQPPLLSDIAPQPSWRATSSRLPKPGPVYRSTALLAAPAVARYGSAPVQSDRTPGMEEAR